MKTVCFTKRVLLLSLLAASLLGAETLKVAAEPTVLTLKNGTRLTVDADYKVDIQAGETLRPVRKMALFVDNNTGCSAFDGAARTLATQVAAGLSGQRMEVLDPRDAAQGRDGSDRLTEASRTRLAEMFGADYVLVLTLDRFDRTVQRLKDARFGKAVDDQGATVKRERYRISGSFRVLDAVSGTSLGGGTAQVSVGRRSTAGLETEDGRFADGLEEQLAQELVKRIRADEPAWRVASLKAGGLPVTVEVLAYDADNCPIYLPLPGEGSSVTNRRVPARVAATVAVDGAVCATSGGVMRLSPGPHRVRIERVGYEPLEMTVVPSENLHLTVNLRMTDAEYARIKDAVRFMHELSKDRELNAAEVERLRGYAKMLEQSGIRVDADKLPDTEIRPLL